MEHTDFLLCVKKTSILSNFFPPLLSWNPVCVPICPKIKKSAIIYNLLLGVYTYRLPYCHPPQNSQSNWSYLLGVNQEDIGCENKEHMETFSYNLEKQLICHAFFKTAPERFLSHYQEYCSSSEQMSVSSSPSPLIFNLKDTMNNLAGQPLPLYHVLESLEPDCGCF